MKFSSYLFSRLYVLLFSLLVLFFLSFSFLFSGSSLTFTLGMDAFGIAMVMLFLFLSFSRSKRKLEKLEEKIASLGDKYLLGEVLEVPEDVVEYEYYRIMKEISSAAVMKVEEEEDARKRYSEYLDSWVHEIKTPLSAMSLILDNGGDKGKLRREIKRAENLTDTILSLSRLDNIEKDKNIRLISLREVVEGALKDEMSLLIPQGVRVEVKGDGNVCTDHMLFSSVLRQILANAAKYAPSSLISFTIQDGLLIVEDNGPGIPPHEIKRVVEKGYVGEKWRGKNGSGMGLYIVREVSRELGIDFSIESEEGKYTRFKFAFPKEF